MNFWSFVDAHPILFFASLLVVCGTLITSIESFAKRP